MKSLFLAVMFVFTGCFSQNAPKKALTQEQGEIKCGSASSAKSESPLKSETIPLTKNQWHSLSYSSLPANQVKFVSEKILIDVQNSASPLIYPMTQNPKGIKKISIQGHATPLIQVDPAEKQGQEGFDDFALRLGLVLLGDKRLSTLESILAPDWVEKMFTLAPPNQGIDHILFLTAVSSPKVLNQKRIHPLSEYLHECYVWLMNQPGNFSYSYTFKVPQQTGALWISADGDDTQSNFKISINKISMETVL